MLQPTTAWIIIVSLLVLIYLVKIIRTIYNHTKFGKSHKIIEMASEEEIFYCPGDKKYWDEKQK